MHYEKEFKIAPGKYSFTLVFGVGGANFGKDRGAVGSGGLEHRGTRVERRGSESRETRPAADLGLDFHTGGRPKAAYRRRALGLFPSVPTNSPNPSRASSILGSTTRIRRR